jgi:hypothetical protein
MPSFKNEIKLFNIKWIDQEVEGVKNGDYERKDIKLRK